MSLVGSCDVVRSNKSKRTSDTKPTQGSHSGGTARRGNKGCPRERALFGAKELIGRTFFYRAAGTTAAAIYRDALLLRQQDRGWFTSPLKDIIITGKAFLQAK